MTINSFFQFSRFFRSLGAVKVGLNAPQRASPWVICGGAGFLLAISAFILFYVHTYYETQIAYLSKAQQAYSEGVQLQENKQKWQNLKEQNQESWARLSKIEKMKTMTPQKIIYLLEHLAKSHGLEGVTVYCDSPVVTQSGGASSRVTGYNVDNKKESPLNFFSCTIKGTTLTDRTAFQFINFLTTYVPPIPCIAMAKIKRLEPLTPALLSQIANKKPVALFSVCLTVEWLFMKDAL